MTTWHIEIKFQAPRGAVFEEGTTDLISDALPPEFRAVSHNTDNELEFVVYGEGVDGHSVYAEAYQRAVDACTDVLGYPVEFRRAEVLNYDHWEKENDPDGSIRAWAEQDFSKQPLPSRQEQQQLLAQLDGNVELTEEVIERLADEAEEGFEPEQFRPRGEGSPTSLLAGTIIPVSNAHVH